MRGIILQDRECYYTFLKDIFALIDNVQTEYNWLISDYECYPQKSKYFELLQGDYCWISGKELTDMVEDENFQWIWGVFSGFPKNISRDEIFSYKLPQSEGYSGFWKNPISIQHPLASIEIVAWDSTLTLIISKEDGFFTKIKERDIKIEDLELYNKL